MELKGFFGMKGVFIFKKDLCVFVVDLVDFGALFLVELSLDLEVYLVLKEWLNGVSSGLIGLAAVKMGFGEFVEILDFFFVYNFFLIKLFTLIVLFSFHEHITVVLDFFHFLDTETVVI